MTQPSGNHGQAYYDAQFNLPAIKLLPGDWVVTQEPQLLVTLLGSCVSACVRDPVNGVCGMNHFMLPGSQTESGASSLSTRFGLQAMELMITRMQNMGAVRKRLQAKVFGAGSVLDGMDRVNIGELNASFILHYLEVESIPLLAHDLLGECARKVYFFTDSGKVMIRHLKSTRSATVKVEEQNYHDRLLRAGAQYGNVELFNHDASSDG